jgi:hypothetical protein
VLENVTEAQDIAVQPGAVWEIPEKARAYLLDLLQGGGVGLHVDFANLVLRSFHDLAEVPRSAFGETKQPLSGVALEMELDPLLKKIARKRLIRGAAFRRRNEMALRILGSSRRVRRRSGPTAHASSGPGPPAGPLPSRGRRGAARGQRHPPAAPPRDCWTSPTRMASGRAGCRRREPVARSRDQVAREEWRMSDSQLPAGVRPFLSSACSWWLLAWRPSCYCGSPART